ncbi:MAG: hypothetical protein CVU44_14690 [Chloroflexi bacterium HGW-Chloroflexi-6]|nr:MAG: hypothetical protein CVU44_14690 [Chloroflexi bacterium HGW-Chloroflexi-6]
MYSYCFAGERFCFPQPFQELASFRIDARAVGEATLFVSQSFPENESLQIISCANGWVGGAQRGVEIYAASQGMLLKIEGGGEFFVSPHGETIGKLGSKDELSQIDREIILGPVLVLALALRGVWSLHASAVMTRDKVTAFLGESGLGKSTLAAYFSQNSGWRRVADDILPTKMNGLKVMALPHFPQLKLSMESQPWIGLPELLPLSFACLLEPAEPDQNPELHRLSSTQAVQALLSHAAGTRLFTPELLAKHLEFSVLAAQHIPTYRLIYPHRRDALPLVREMLESLC